MRTLRLGTPAGGKPSIEWIVQALHEIERASFEELPGEVFDQFVITNLAAPVRTLDVSTATTADIAAVLGTLIQDMKKRGAAERGAS